MPQVAKKELALECDYAWEATAQERFSELVAAQPDMVGVVRVPAVVRELCSARVLTSEWVPGVHIDKVQHACPRSTLQLLLCLAPCLALAWPIWCKSLNSSC